MKMKTETDAQRCEDFPVHTSQEMDAINRARANGKTFNGYAIEPQTGSVFYHHAALAHRVELALTSTERAAGIGSEHLEKLVRAQDADGLIAQLYILGVLAPFQLSEGVARGTGWINFDDVIAKIGWYPQTAAARREMHARIWEFVQFGERAVIVGERNRAYLNPNDKSKIETRISTALWRVHAVEEPEQGELNFDESVPIGAQIVISPIILELVTSPWTAQFLPMGETIGAIAGGNASGAWARVIALALASFWRRHPAKSLSQEIQTTRRELLTHYPPKVAPLDELLQSQNNARAIQYWCEALQILIEHGILSDEGETQISKQEMRAALPRRDWHARWLDQKLHLTPSAQMQAHIQRRAAAIIPAPARRRAKAKKPVE